MALSINLKGTVSLTLVTGTTFTQKMQNAGTLTTYPEGTVFDCSSYKSETITDTITIRRPGITFLFGEGDFTMSAVNRNMFNIEAPNVTIIGTSRSAKDSLSSNGPTRFVMTSTTNTGPNYHVFTRTSGSVGWNSADSLTIMNCDFVGVKSAYTSSSGTVSYSNWGCGGFLLTEGNPDQSGSNLNNLYINEVLIDGSTNHGITVYGGMLSKIQNTRVRNAGGHGFYIAGSSTSMNLDTCYASGAHLAGFCLQATTYSTLNNCASDSNGLGYWMRASESITMSSCGAEACQVRSSIPYTLGITLQSSAGTVTVNDIGFDNAGFIKGTSYLFTGGANITGTACYSKDPSNRAGQTTFLSKYSSHIHVVYDTEKLTMLNFNQGGTSPLKYQYRLEGSVRVYIDCAATTYDPNNPIESSDGAMTPVAGILDQGTGNVFGDMYDSTSFEGRRALVANPTENYRVQNLLALDRFTLPTFSAHPANPVNGTIYFNTALNKLYMFNDGWHDTCCATAPTPPPSCVFPNGGIQQAAIIFPGPGQSFGASSSNMSYKLYSKVFNMATGMMPPFAVGNSNNVVPMITVFNTITEQSSLLLTIQDIFNAVGGWENPSTAFVYASNNPVFSEDTQSFYIGITVSHPEVPQPGQSLYVGSDQFLIKFNIGSNTIDAFYAMYNISEQDANAYNVFGGVSSIYTIDTVNNRLTRVVAHYNGDNPVPFYIDYYNINNLTSIGGSSNTEFPNIAFSNPAAYRYMNVINLPNNKVIIPRGYGLAGETHKFTVMDLDGVTTQTIDYDNQNYPTTKFNTVNITPCYTTEGQTFFISDTVTQKIYEIDSTTFSTVNEWSLGFPISNVIDKVINGNRILFYTKFVSNPNNTGSLFFEAYNINTEQVLGSLFYGTSTITFTQIQVSSIFSMPIIPENDFIYLSETLLTRKLCAPYAS